MGRPLPEHERPLLAHWPVPLAVATVGGARDDSGRLAMGQPVVVRPLEGEAPPARDHEDGGRYDEDGNPNRVGDAVEAEVEAGGEDVVAAGGPQQP